MKQRIRIIIISIIMVSTGFAAAAQCSICTKTASQLGEDAGRGLNGGIIYLAAAPLLIAGFIAYRWWKNNY